VTAPVLTPYRASQQPGRDGFWQLLHAELTKFRTVRGWLIGLAAGAVVMVLLGVYGSGTSNIACVKGNGKVQTGAACTPPPPPTGPGGEAVDDQSYFVHQPLAGNGSITAQVTSFTGRYSGGPGGPQGPSLQNAGLQPWSKAGIIIKASTKQGSAYAAMAVTGSHGVRMQYDYTQDSPGLAGSVSVASPRWLRLTRSGDTVTGYDSADGRRWTEVGTAQLTGLPATVQIGLFATSPDHSVVTTNFGGGTSGSGGPSTATATFGQVSLTGAAARGSAWAGTAIGGSDPAIATGFQQAGGRLTVTGSGDIAPLVPGEANNGGRAKTVEQHLVGAFAGLIAMAVVAVLFITTEYRRGLIRTTLTASPRRGRVLAAKAVAVGSVTFVVGLAAAVVAYLVGLQQSRAQSQYVLPVPLLTEVRVIVGTAAMLAVAAVLALAVGTLLRRSALAVTAVTVGIVLPYIMAIASLLPVGAGDWLLRLTPAAGFAIQQSIPAYPQVNALYAIGGDGGGFYPLSPWAGFGVLCAYTAAALALAAFLLRRRDA
jgi:ABC-type transport system involved in multi-copper enzyme maturation permease subunit